MVPSYGKKIKGDIANHSTPLNLKTSMKWKNS